MMAKNSKGKGKAKGRRRTAGVFRRILSSFGIPSQDRFFCSWTTANTGITPRGILRGGGGGEGGDGVAGCGARIRGEETGIRQVDRVGRFERDMHYVFRSPKKGVVHKTVTYFLGRTREEKVKLSDEHEGHAWLPLGEAMERLTFDNAREVLRAAAESMSKR